MIFSCEMPSEVESKIVEAYNKMLEHGIVQSNSENKKTAGSCSWEFRNS
jgi:hypothetical protein